MKKVLITGGAGFIGYHLGKFLADRGDEVHLLDNFYRGVLDDDLKQLSERKNVRLLKADLEQRSCVEESATDYDYVYHLAALIGVSKVLTEPYNVLTKNFVLLQNALDIARRQKRLARFVFFSTSEVYAGTLERFGLELPTPETSALTAMDPRTPRSSYMLSKIYGEGMCAHSGLPYTVVRPHNFYGPRMGLSHVVPELLQKAYRAPEGAEIDVYSPGHTRTFCYISDAVEQIVRLAESEKGANDAFNIGTQSPEIRIGELAETVFGIVGRKTRAKPMPDTPGSPARRCPNMKKTATATGYESRVSLKEGIQRTFDWYRSHVFDSQGISAK